MFTNPYLRSTADTALRSLPVPVLDPISLPVPGPAPVPVPTTVIESIVMSIASFPIPDPVTPQHYSRSYYGSNSWFSELLPFETE